ncbi:MAG TPA: hypothetical protein VKE69_09535 [Planctomycetota bacterium]|nr:hypothetical protein [Planctomycetota bacterium]
MPHPARRLLALPLAALLATAAAAQSSAPLASANRFAVVNAGTPRVADPKLAGGSIPVRYRLEGPAATASVVIEIFRGIDPVATLYGGTEAIGSAIHEHVWDGKWTDGKFADPGAYVVRVSATPTGGAEAHADLALSLVRLGITEIAAQSSGSTTNEWPLVYYKKGGAYGFFATPQIHEYLNVADAGQVSDLDLDDGSARPPVPVHLDLASPPLEGTIYEDDAYNFPLCYAASSQPALQVRFGSTGTSMLLNGSIGAGFPVDGVDLRVVASDGAGDWTPSGPIAAGDSATITGPALPGSVARTDRTVVFRWQWKEGSSAWRDVPGSLPIALRFYTVLGTPLFAPGATGTAHAGPWVEVVDTMVSWSQALGVDPSDEAHLVEVGIRGFFGQTGSLTTAIKGVCYDCPSMGGDGGANHYFNAGTKYVALSKLLNAHASGKYVNCSDVASSTSSMLSMLGVANLHMLRLGAMSLNAIWGIGTPGYTVNLWGTGHSFSYHHIVTRDGGTNVSDACMWVDEDGSPGSLPGTPGINVDRPWTSYMPLAATNSVTKTLDILPKLQ